MRIESSKIETKGLNFSKTKVFKIQTLSLSDWGEERISSGQLKGFNDIAQAISGWSLSKSLQEIDLSYCEIYKNEIEKIVKIHNLESIRIIPNFPSYFDED